VDKYLPTHCLHIERPPFEWFTQQLKNTVDVDTRRGGILVDAGTAMWIALKRARETHVVKG
jgi:hypothetical protein